MRTMLTMFTALMAVCLLAGCAAPYGLYADERKMGEIVDDNALELDLKSTLMEQNFSEGFSVSVNSYDGRVFLVGQAPAPFRAKAEKIARDFKGVRSVRAHWFTGSSTFEGDTALALRLKKNLIEAKNVSSTQVECEVHNGQVVVMGVVANKAAADRVLKAVRATEGVKTVTSFLLY